MQSVAYERARLDLEKAMREEGRAEGDALYRHNPTHRELAFRRRMEAEHAFEAVSRVRYETNAFSASVIERCRKRTVCV